MRDVTCQCHCWLSVAQVNSVGEKWFKTTDCFRISEAWNHKSLFCCPRIRAFHSLSAHILQILLIPPLKYNQNPTTFNQLHHCFWFDLILIIWLSVIAGKKWQNVILGTCPFFYLGDHRKAVVYVVTCFLQGLILSFTGLETHYQHTHNVKILGIRTHHKQIQRRLIKCRISVVDCQLEM